VIHRLIVTCKSVEFAPCTIDHFVDCTAFDLVGRFKHQVLEKVRKASTGWIFVAGTNFVMHYRCNNGRRVILVEDNVKTIRQVVLFEVKGLLPPTRK
jgi:hypothetical protein